MATTLTFSQDLIAYCAKLSDLGEWTSGVHVVSDSALMITTYDTVCILDEVCDPSSVSRQLNIRPLYLTFSVLSPADLTTTEHNNSSHLSETDADDDVSAAEMKAIRKKQRRAAKMKLKERNAVSMEDAKNFDPAISKTPMWLAEHQKNVFKTKSAPGLPRDRLILALLHRYHDVIIYRVTSLGFVVVSNLNLSASGRHSKRSNKPNDSIHPSFYSSPIDLCWSLYGTVGGSTIHFLYVIMKAGNIMVWRVVTSSDRQSEVEVDSRVEFCLEVDSTRSRPACLHYKHKQQCLAGCLVVGYVDGTIDVRDVTCADVGEDCAVTVGAPTMLWSDVDGLSATIIVDGFHKDELIVAKENFLLSFRLNPLTPPAPPVVLTPPALSVVLTPPAPPVVLTPPAPPVVLRRFLYTIKGVHVTRDKMIAASQGLYVLIKDSDHTVEVSLANRCEESMTSVDCHGAAISRNAAYCVILRSPRGVQKDKANKFPFEVEYILIKQIDQLVLHLQQLLDGDTSCSLSDVYDILECIRRCVTSGQPYPHQLLNGCRAEPHTTFKLKLSRFLLKLQHTAISKAIDLTEPSLTTVEEQITEVEMKILMRHFATHKSTRSPRAGDGEHGGVNGGWMEKGLAFPKPEADTCIVCRAEIPFESPLRATCANGHSFQRCGWTLRTCDAVKHRRCINCSHPYVNLLSSTSRPNVNPPSSTSHHDVNPPSSTSRHDVNLPSSTSRHDVNLPSSKTRPYVNLPSSTSLPPLCDSVPQLTCTFCDGLVT